MTPTLRSSVFKKPSILQKTLFDFFSLAKDLVSDEAISKRSFEDKLIYSFNKDPLRVVQMITASTVLVMFVVHVHPHPILNRLRPSFFRLVLFGLILGGLIDIVANMQPYVLDEAEAKASASENVRSSLTLFATSQSSIALMFFISIWLVSSQFTKSYGALPKLIVVGLGLFSVAQFAPTLALLIALSSHDVFEEFLPQIQLLWSASKGEKDGVEAADLSATSLADVIYSSIGSVSSPIHSLLRDIQRLGHVALIIGGLSLMKLLTQHGSDSLSSMATTTAIFLVWFQITQLAVREVTDQGTSLQRIRSLLRSLFGYVRDEEEDDNDDFDWKTVKGSVSVSAIHGFFRRVKAFGTNVMTEVRDNLAAFEPTQIIEDEAEEENDKVEGDREGNDHVSASEQQERMESKEPLASSKTKRRLSSAQRGKRLRRRQALKRKIQQQRRRRLKPASEVNELDEIDTSSHQDAEASECSEGIEESSVDTEEEPLSTVDADTGDIDENGHVEPMSSVEAIEEEAEEENDQGEGRPVISLDGDRQQDDVTAVDHVSEGSDNDHNLTLSDNTDDLTSASSIEETGANERDVGKDEEEEEEEDEDEVVVEEEDPDDEGDEGTAGETTDDDLATTESVSSQSTPSNVSTSIDDANETSSSSSRTDSYDEQEPSSVEACYGPEDDGAADLVDEGDDSVVDNVDATAGSEVVRITDEDEVEHDGETEGIVVDDPVVDEDDDNDSEGSADVDSDGLLLSSDSEHLVGTDGRGGPSSDEVETTEASATDARSSPPHADDEPLKEHEQPVHPQVGDDGGRSDDVADAAVDDVVVNDQDVADDEEADYVYEYEYEYEYEDGEPATASTAPGHSTVHNTTTSSTIATQANDGFAPSLFAGDDAEPWPQ